MSTATKSLGLTDYQREQRAKRLTATDMAAVLGLSKYKTPYDVWAIKTGKVPEDYQGSEAADLGLRLQDGLLDLAADRLGEGIIRNQWRTGDHPHLGATLDAITQTTNEPVEAKTHGLLNARALDMSQWGEDGSDVVPDEHVIQVTVQMIVTSAKAANLIALLSGFGTRLYRIPYIPIIADEIQEKASEFWEKHVQADVPPPAPNGAPMEILKRMPREAGKSIEVSDELAEEYAIAHQLLKDAEERADRAKSLVRKVMAESHAEIATSKVGKFKDGLCAGAMRLNTEAMKEAHPDLVAKFMQRGADYRRFTFTAAKGGAK